MMREFKDDNSKIVSITGSCGDPKDCTGYRFAYDLMHDEVLFYHKGFGEGCIGVVESKDINHWDDIIEYVKENELNGSFHDVQYYYREIKDE